MELPPFSILFLTTAFTKMSAVEIPVDRFILASGIEKTDLM